MNIQVIESSKIEADLWDDFVVESPQGSIYALHQSLDALCENWAAIHVYHDGQLRAVFPFQSQRKYFISYSYPPMFTQFLGLICAKNVTEADSVQIQKLVIDYFKEAFSAFSQSFSPNMNDLGIWKKEGFKIETKKTYILSLGKDPDKLFKNFSENLRRNIKKGSKRFETPVVLETSDELVDLFKQEKGKEIDSIRDYQYKAYSQWINHLINQNRALVFGLRSANGGLIAGVVLLIYKNQMIYSLGGVKAEWRSSGASPFIIWHGIQKAINLGAELFDFEGSVHPGIERFFKSFGSQMVNYYAVHKRPFYMKTP